MKIGDVSFWYADMGLPETRRPALSGDTSVDVAIIGAGFTGLWTALDRLETSAMMAEYFGPRYPAAYAAIKRSEFEAFLAEVLPREYDWYL